MRRRAFVFRVALVAVAVVGLAACGNGDGGDVSSTSGTTVSPDAPDTVEGTPAVMGGDFTLGTSDGTVEITGPASSCVNPDEGTLDVTFGDDGSTVVVALAGGTGTVSSTGDYSYEGTITDFTISDSGGVTLSGTGPDAGTFTLTGQCVP